MEEEIARFELDMRHSVKESLSYLDSIAGAEAQKHLFTDIYASFPYIRQWRAERG